MRPQLLTRQLGSDLYKPAEALSQLVANALDAECSRVDITIEFNQLNGPACVTISDDGHGMTPEMVDQAFATVGQHVQSLHSKREVIGSRGIGRFAVFALAAESSWTTVAHVGDALVRQSWDLTGQLRVQVRTDLAPGASPGTTISVLPRISDSVVWLFSSPLRVKRILFNAFAGYLLRYRDEVEIWVNDDRIDPDEYIEQSCMEVIDATDAVPEARLHHLVLGPQVDQQYPCVLQFATRGATITSHQIEGDAIAGKKYLGLVDSPYLVDLTNTAKSDLAMMDEKFLALNQEAIRRAKAYIELVRGDRIQTFLEEARAKPFYPYPEAPSTIIEACSKEVYDRVLASLEEGFRISGLQTNQQRLVFLLAQQLLHSEDLATILSSVLQLDGEYVSKLAELLKSTSLNSIIAVADLLVGRLQFLQELRSLVYGQPAAVVKERHHLHKIVANHTWLFGEQYNLMGSDISMHNLIEEVRRKVGGFSDDPDSHIDVDGELRDIPDLYFVATKWNQGAEYHQHLIVELKRPSVRITNKHIDQLERYADQLVTHPTFGQRSGSHRFTFVLVSSQVSDRVKNTKYQQDQEPGFLGRPRGLGHPTELWALQWSDYIDRRDEELKFLQEKIQLTADPETLEYLRRTSSRFLPPEVATDEKKAS